MVQSAIISRWFKGKEMALAFGIALTISRVGTLFSFNTEQLISDYFGSYRIALWAAAGFCLFSVLCNLVYIAMDQHGEKVLALPKPEAGDKIVFSDIKKVQLLLLVRSPSLRHLSIAPSSPSRPSPQTCSMTSGAFRW